MTEKELLPLLQKIQSGGFNDHDKARYDPDFTGCGVSIMAIAEHWPDSDPLLVAVAARSLARKGLVRAIDPDALGFVSFDTRRQPVVQAANKAIAALYTEGRRLRPAEELLGIGLASTKEPVNWAVLRCTDATLDGDGKTVLTVEEADPLGCDALKDYLQDALRRAEFPDCRVETEW